MLIRQLEGVAGRIQRVFLGERWEPSGPTNGRQDAAPVPEGPFPSYQFSLRNGKNRSRARGLCAACVPLTDFFRSGTWIRRERGRGSQGVSPWRSMRRRLIRAVRRAASLRRQSSLPTNSATEPVVVKKSRSFFTCHQPREGIEGIFSRRGRGLPNAS